LRIFSIDTVLYGSLIFPKHAGSGYLKNIRIKRPWVFVSVLPVLSGFFECLETFWFRAGHGYHQTFISQVRAGAECFTIGTLLVTHAYAIGQRTMKELALDQGPL
jgi:hypothetical protein